MIVELGAGPGRSRGSWPSRPARTAGSSSWSATPTSAACSASGSTDRPNFDVVEGDVRDLAAILADRGIGQVDYIVSGLPVPSFPRDLQQSLFRVVGQVLKPEGTFNQITELPWVYWRFYRKYLRRRPVRLRAPQPPARRGLLLPGRQTGLLSPDERHPPSPSIRSPRDTGPAFPAVTARGVRPGAQRWSSRASICTPGSARRRSRLDPVATQERVLRSLVRKAQDDPVRPRPRLRPRSARSPTSRRPSRCGPTRTSGTTTSATATRSSTT